MKTERAFIELIRQATITLRGFNSDDPCCQNCIDLNKAIVEARKIRKYA